MSQGISANFVTWVFAIFLFGIFLIALVKRQKTKGSPFVLYAPTLLTTLGILGTFTGVVIGLWDFDVTNIDKSIPSLLEGLKTAFITSVLGMLLSILFKTRDVWSSENDEEKLIDEDISPGMMYEQLVGQSESLHQIVRSIAGEDESTLVGQLKLLRGDLRDEVGRLAKQAEANRDEFNDFRMALKKQLEDFAEMLAKSATEQVIEALKNVISDFNKNLTEQFGENFKQLNAAVRELVQWQENYRLQLEDMSRKYEQGVLAIEKTEIAVSEIGRESKEIPIAMEKLKEVVLAARAQTDELSEHLSAFADMRNKAVEAVPQIKNQMEMMANDVAEANKLASNLILEGSKAANDMLISGAEDFRNRVEQTNASLTSTSDALSVNSESIKNTLSDASDDLRSQMRDMVEKLSEANSSLVADFKEAVAKIMSGIADSNERFSQGSKQMLADFKSASDGVIGEFSAQSKKVNADIESTATKMAERNIQATNLAFEEIKRGVSKTVDGFEQSLNSQIAALDKALENELQRVISSMGNKIAGISDQFSKDYSALTDQMVSIINQVRKSGLNER